MSTEDCARLCGVKANCRILQIGLDSAKTRLPRCTAV